mgnify:CR=1 FL=1
MLCLIGAYIFEVIISCVLMYDNKCISMYDNKDFSVVGLIILCVNALLVLLIVGTLGKFAPLYLSESSTFANTDVFNMSSDLLACASKRMPELSTYFLDINNCLKHVNVYEVRNGRVPYLRHVPQAFVLSFDQDSVFVSSRYLLLSVVDRALVMIHECAHIGLGAEDHAYIWQDHYEHLTYDEHLANADSFRHVVMEYCAI